MEGVVTSTYKENLMVEINLTMDELKQAILIKLNDKGVSVMPDNFVLNINEGNGHIKKMDLDEFEDLDVYLPEPDPDILRSMSNIDFGDILSGFDIADVDNGDPYDNDNGGSG
jgi:hypothetical protein